MTAVRVFPCPTLFAVFPFSQVTDVFSIVDKAEGVKVRMLVNCPPVLLVNLAVNPIVAEEFPTWFAEVNERVIGVKARATTGCRVIDHISAFPEVTRHVHILGSLSLGHSP